MSELTKDTLINNRYVLIEHKGSGSFGEVWLAHDKIADQQIALKIYISLDPHGIDEFKAEYKLAVDLTHPNLLTANYLDVWQQRPFLVMKYCANGSSGTLAGKIDETTLIHFIHDVAAGLRYLHEQPDPIIHQDIKPDNILMDQDGIFLITDFGISKKIRSTMRKLSSRSIGAGATAYMGPERFDANPTPVKASDIWSLGASIYEMATGELPFNGMGGGMQRNGADMPSLDSSWSPELNQLMQACLAKETWDRPTAAQLEVYTAALLEGAKPEIPWKIVNQPSSFISHEAKNRENLNDDSISDNIVRDTTDNQNIDLHHYKGIKKVINTIYITFISMLLLTTVLGTIGVSKHMYITETIGIGIANCFILLLVGLSAIKAIKKHKNNALFKTKLFFAAVLFYWCLISIISNTLGIFKLVIIAICINGFRMISTSVEINQLFPKNNRRYGLKDIFVLLLAFLLPICIEFLPYNWSMSINNKGIQTVNTEINKPHKKAIDKKNKEKQIKRNSTNLNKKEHIMQPHPDQTDDEEANNAKKLKTAIRNKDYQTVQRLANKGYKPAFVPLAKFYLDKNDYDDANRYAQKARKENQPGAQEIIQLLTNLGYFD